MKQGLILFILAIVVYSLGNFAYIHSNFTSKEVMVLICERLNRIELKIDQVLFNKDMAKKSKADPIKPTV